MSIPRCFLSYSWDSQALKDWVRFLAGELRKNGVDTSLDQWDCHPGMDLTKYMETSIRESDYVLLICTSTFSKKANSGAGGVGYEKTIVTGEIFQGSTPRKFIPILREGNPKQSLPSYLKSKVFIDFRNDEEFYLKLEDLLRQIYKSPKHVRPPLGLKPSFTNSSKQPIPSRKKAKKKWDFAIYKLVHDYAASYYGMKLIPEHARKFADEWMSEYPDKKFDDYKEIYEYATSSIGMKLSPSEAREFADEWMIKYPDRTFDDFKQVYDYAASYYGMKLSPSEAREFANEWMIKYPDKKFDDFKQVYEYAISSIGMKLSPSEAREFALEKLEE